MGYFEKSYFLWACVWLSWWNTSVSQPPPPPPPTHTQILFTERGVCLPTVSLWILFVYIEAAIRFKDLKNFHVDLCRPFAAHWWVSFFFCPPESAAVCPARPTGPHRLLCPIILKGNNIICLLATTNHDSWKAPHVPRAPSCVKPLSVILDLTCWACTVFRSGVSLLSQI